MNEDLKILLMQLAFLACVGVVVWLLAGCTINVRHEYPMPMPSVLDRMDYA